MTRSRPSRSSQASWQSRSNGKTASASFEKCHAELTGLQRLDCGLAVDGHSFDTFDGGGRHNYCKSENALVYFLFRFLNQLQSLGTVPAIDWNQYASQLST